MATSIPSIDTNVLLRLILQDNTLMFEKAVKLVTKHEQIAVADQAIVEVVFALGGYYEYSRTEIANVVGKLVNNQAIVMNRSLFAEVLPKYVKHTGVSFTDCCLAAYAKLNGQTPLYTFDKKMARDLPHVDLVE